MKVVNFCKSICSGGTPLRSEASYWENGTIPWLKTGEIKKEYVHSTEESISELGLNNSSTKLVPKNSILIAMYGDGDTAGHVAINKIDLATNQACCNLTIDENKAHYRYIYFLFKGNYQNLINLKLGGSQQNLNATTIKNLDFNLPSLPIQRKIAAVLSAYDDLIENNNRRIAILEEMAEQLYREWFVRLRFLGHKKVKIVKGVPEGWDVKRIREVVDRKGFGRIYRETELQAEGSVVVIDQSVSECLGYYDGEPEHRATKDNPIILFGDHSCKMQMMIKPFSLAENVVPFIAHGDMPTVFLFYLIHNSIETTEYKRHWTELVNKKVFVPNEKLQKAFADYVTPLTLQAEQLRAGNRKARISRDRLLSRLMSGKIDVKKLDIHFPASMQEEVTASA